MSYLVLRAFNFATSLRHCTSSSSSPSSDRWFTHTPTYLCSVLSKFFHVNFHVCLHDTARHHHHHRQCSSTSPLSSSCSKLCCGTRPDVWYGASISRATTLTRDNSASLASSRVPLLAMTGCLSVEWCMNESSTASWYARMPATSLRFFTSECSNNHNH